MRLEQFENLAHPDAFDLNSKPLLIADGNSIDLDNLPSKVTAKSVCMARLNVADVHLICSRLNTTAIYLHRVHLTDYESLQSVKRLRYLEVYGNPKAVDYATLPKLHLLKLFDNYKNIDAGFLADQSDLRSLSISGGFSVPTNIDSLEPISKLSKLIELELLAVRVKAESQLRPLVKCKSLKKLTLSNTFETEEYAHLSVKMPKVECAMFAAYVSISGNAIAGKDVMVVGRKKPFLNSKHDAVRLEKYQERFKELQEASRG